MVNNDPHKAKKNQNILKIVLFSFLFIIIAAWVTLTSNDEPKNKLVKKNIENKELKLNLTSEAENVKTKWIGQVSTNVDINNEKYKLIEKENQKIKDEMKEIKLLLKARLKEGEGKKQSLTKRKTFNMGTYKSFPLPPSMQEKENNDENDSFNGKIRNIKKTTIKLDSLPNSLGFNEIIVNDENEDDDSEDKIIKNLQLLSTGSITKVQLMNGFDAPTMAQAKTNPLPILMKVVDLSILPNFRKYDLRECFILGEGYGDLSSERVYIRTNTLSCVTDSGKHIEVKFKGMATGEFGKVGLRGRVVSKQGAALARTIIAGFIGSVGTAFGNQSTTTTTNSVLGTTTSNDLNGSEAVKSGVYAGLGKGADKLQDFYLKLADQTSPVIEIDSMRIIDVVLTSSIELKTVEDLSTTDSKEKND